MPVGRDVSADSASLLLLNLTAPTENHVLLIVKTKFKAGPGHQQCRTPTVIKW